MNTRSSKAAIDGVVFMLISTVLLSTMHALVRHLSVDLHPFVIVFFRNLFGFVAIAPLLIKAGPTVFKTNNYGIHCFRAIVGICAMLTFFYSLSKVPITNVTALSFSTTIFASLFAVILLKEKIRTRRWLAILAGFIGVIIVLRPAADGFNAWSLLVLGSAVAWGMSVTLVKILTNSESSTTIVGIMTIALLVLSIPPAMLFWTTPNGTQLLILLVVGVLATAGHLLLAEALKRSDVAITMSVDFSRLIWTALLGSWFFSEQLSRYTALGGLIIFAAGWYIVFRESKHSAKTAPEITTI